MWAPMRATRAAARAGTFPRSRIFSSMAAASPRVTVEMPAADSYAAQPTHGVILAAGLGSRLRPFTDSLPKAKNLAAAKTQMTPARFAAGLRSSGGQADDPARPGVAAVGRHGVQHHCHGLRRGRLRRSQGLCSSSARSSLSASPSLVRSPFSRG